MYRHLKLNRIPTRAPKRIALDKKTSYLLYVKERKSLAQIADMLGCTPSGVLKVIRSHGIERRSISETSTKHQKYTFDGDDCEKAYIIGFRLGDLGVREKGNLIYISSSTTKTAQVALIKDLFSRYGPVWVSRSDTKQVWNVSCALNRSFSFLIPKHERIPLWIQKSPEPFFSFVAGYTDAEGSILIAHGSARFRIRSSYDEGVLRDIHGGLCRRGVKSTFGLASKAGVSGNGLKRTKNCWYVAVAGKEAVFRLLTILTPFLRHQKRVYDATVALANVKSRIETS